MLVRLMPREIHTNVITGVSLVECLRVLDEREAQDEECLMLMAMVNK